MTISPTDRCGYVFPEHEETPTEPQSQSCCYRKALPDSSRCIWHADYTRTDYKSVKELKETRGSDTIGEEISNPGELLDGANLSGLKLNGEISFEDTSLRGVQLSETILDNANLSGADLGGAYLEQASLKHADLSGANLDAINCYDTTFNEANLSNVTIRWGNISDTEFRHSELCDTKIKKCDLSEVTFAGSDLKGVSFSKNECEDVSFNHTDMSNAHICDCRFQGVIFWHSDLSSCSLITIDDGSDYNGIDFSFADLSDSDLGSNDMANCLFNGANLSNAKLTHADLSSANFSEANLSNANIDQANCDNVNFGNSNLTDSNMSNSNLKGANLTHANLIRTNLFGANLTDSVIHGATVADVQINPTTVIRSEKQRKKDAKWWQVGPLQPPPRCRHDPSTPSLPEEYNDYHIGNSEASGSHILPQTFANTELSQAANTYKTLEKLARDNALPSLQTKMFVLRQDMQRKRHWHNGKYLNWAFARTSRGIFKYGESLARIISCSIFFIVAYAAIYTQFDLITDGNGEIVINLVDALYFSTLTFTTLGLGDFQPNPTSQFARLLVTSQAALGAILIAIFVFVMGRRAAR